MEIRLEGENLQDINAAQEEHRIISGLTMATLAAKTRRYHPSV
jgi:hypothetical protein